MSKEQLAGLVEEIGDELEMAGYGAVTQLPTESLRDWHKRLAAILATLPEPGVVTDEVARVAVNAYDRATGEGWQMPCVQGMRSALEAALPYLAPAAPAGEVVVTRAGSSDGPIVAVTRQDGEGRVLSTIATYEPAPAAQGFDAEFWKKAWVEERARAYRREGMTVEQARIHAETDAALMEQAARQQEENDDD